MALLVGHDLFTLFHPHLLKRSLWAHTKTLPRSKLEIGPGLSRSSCDPGHRSKKGNPFGSKEPVLLGTGALLVVTSATLVVTSALLVVTRSY